MPVSRISVRWFLQEFRSLDVTLSAGVLSNACLQDFCPLVPTGVWEFRSLDVTLSAAVLYIVCLRVFCPQASPPLEGSGEV